MQRLKNLYESHKEAIFRYFLRLTGSWEEAGELTQEVFYQACVSFYRFRQEATLKTWLFSIARNVFLKHLREKSRLKNTMREADKQYSGQEADPPEIIIQKEERERLRQALDRLPETARSVIILKEYEQLSYEEIALVCGQTVNWARVTFFRAKKQLGSFYREMEVRRNEDE